MHLILDARLPIERRCWDETRARALVVNLVRVAGLHIIAGPFTASWRNKVQAIALMAESHVSAEIDTETGEVHVDIFSCKRVPSSAARVAFAELRPEGWRLRVLARTEVP